MNDYTFEKIVKSFNDSKITVEEIFDDMENTVPFARCRECIHRHNAMRGGANIFCSCMNGKHNYAIVTDNNASDCKHFSQKNDETDKIEKQAIEMLIKQEREN